MTVLSRLDAQRAASQLNEAIAAHAVVDQAKGVLMHALGCPRTTPSIKCGASHRHSTSS